jgi:aminomethyltransferase
MDPAVHTALRSPLHRIHVGLGAAFTDFAGWAMPLRYKSELAEHETVRSSAGLFDLTHMGEILVEGPEAAIALDRALVGNLSGLAVGRARYTMLCAPDGGVLDDLVVYRLDETRFMVVANASNRTVVAGELRFRAAGLETEVVDRSLDTALVAVQGPASAAIVESATGSAVDDLTYYASRPASIGGLRVLLARTGYTGEDGFEIYSPVEHAVEIWQLLTEIGDSYDVRPAGLACRDTLRLEAGMPLYGNELTHRTTPFDAGLGRVVKFDKASDFVGRTALQRRRDQPSGQVLVGLRGSGRRAPRPGYTVLRDGVAVGRITSGALSPTLGHPVAMAYVDRDASEPGTELIADVRGQPEPVDVVALPFYKRTS